MNERIKELKEQAEQYALDKANEGDDEDFDYSFDDDFQEKFADLIIKECIDVIDYHMSIYRTSNSIYEKGIHDGMAESIRLIENKFGLERDK